MIHATQKILKVKDLPETIVMPSGVTITRKFILSSPASYRKIILARIKKELAKYDMLPDGFKPPEKPKRKYKPRPKPSAAERKALLRTKSAIMKAFWKTHPHPTKKWSSLHLCDLTHQMLTTVKNAIDGASWNDVLLRLVELCEKTGRDKVPICDHDHGRICHDLRVDRALVKRMNDLRHTMLSDEWLYGMAQFYLDQNGLG